MKKIRFIDLVLSHLARLGATEAELEKQRKYIDSYLTNLGIGEEADELDYESPSGFAEEVFGIIKAHRATDVEAPSPIAEAFVDEKEVEFFEATEEDSDYSELGAELESELEDDYDEEEYATREFSINDAQDDYYALGEDEEIEEEEYIPSGNPVFFWIIVAILSPVWVSLGLFALALCATAFVLLSIFIIAYIPLLIALIIGGSVAILDEIVFSIVKFVGGAVHIGFFELGLAFFIGATVVTLSVLIYRFGTKYAVPIWRNYWLFFGGVFAKLKRLIRKFKGVCSI